MFPQVKEGPRYNTCWGSFQVGQQRPTVSPVNGSVTMNCIRFCLIRCQYNNPFSSELCKNTLILFKAIPILSCFCNTSSNPSFSRIAIL
uniref:Uncharacterized protein n=1 Tax=Octopus bimaculoides TaxID=37653 RepID=A0A0L8I192_OCTBM